MRAKSISRSKSRSHNSVKTTKTPRVKTTNTPRLKPAYRRIADIDGCIHKLRSDDSALLPNVSHNNCVSDLKTRVHYLLEKGKDKDYIINALCTISKTITHNEYTGKQITIENPRYTHYCLEIEKIIDNYLVEV